jgi:integrase
MTRSFDRIIAETGLPKIAFHDLRRTAATLLTDLGVPARDAQVILGHSRISVTLGIYSEVFDDQISTALSRMDGALGSPRPDRGPHRRADRPEPPHLTGP